MVAGGVHERQDEAAQQGASQLLAAVLQGGVARLPLPLRAQVPFPRPETLTADLMLISD